VQLSNRVHLVHGRFHDTLPHMLERLGRVEFAFVDGHHDEQATVQYVDTIAGAATEDAVFVIDDIRWSDGMTRAWHVIGSRPDVGAVIDLEAMGIVVRGWERRELALTL
jgi:predicted O-methyltransferase YrrM